MNGIDVYVAQQMRRDGATLFSDMGLTSIEHRTVGDGHIAQVTFEGQRSAGKLHPGSA